MAQGAQDYNLRRRLPLRKPHFLERVGKRQQQQRNKCKQAKSDKLLKLLLTRSCWSECAQKLAALKKLKAGKPLAGCLNAAPDTPIPKPTACFENVISVKCEYHIEHNTTARGCWGALRRSPLRAPQLIALGDRALS